MAPQTQRKKLNIVSFDKFVGLGKYHEDTRGLIRLSFHRASLLFVSSLRVKEFISIVYALTAEALTAWTLEVTLQIGFILLVVCFAAHLWQFLHNKD